MMLYFKKFVRFTEYLLQVEIYNLFNWSNYKEVYLAVRLFSLQVMFFANLHFYSLISCINIKIYLYTMQAMV